MALCPDCALDEHKEHRLSKYQEATNKSSSALKSGTKKVEEEVR